MVFGWGSPHDNTSYPCCSEDFVWRWSRVPREFGWGTGSTQTWTFGVALLIYDLLLLKLLLILVVQNSQGLGCLVLLFLSIPIQVLAFQAPPWKPLGSKWRKDVWPWLDYKLRLPGEVVSQPNTLKTMMSCIYIYVVKLGFFLAKVIWMLWRPYPFKRPKQQTLWWVQARSYYMMKHHVDMSFLRQAR